MADERFKNKGKITIRQKIELDTHSFLYSIKTQLRKTLGEAIDFVVTNYRETLKELSNKK